MHIVSQVSRDRKKDGGMRMCPPMGSGRTQSTLLRKGTTFSNIGSSRVKNPLRPVHTKT